MRCEWNKTWSTLPTCEPLPCSNPPVIQHGQPEHQSSLPSFETFFYVNPGHDFNDENLQFSGDASTKDHGVLPHASNFFSSDALNQNQTAFSNQSPNLLANRPFVPKTDGFVFGDVVHYACDKGHTHNSSRPDSIACQSNGDWSSPMPVCEPISCHPLPTM